MYHNCTYTMYAASNHYQLRYRTHVNGYNYTMLKTLNIQIAWIFNF